MGMGNVDMLGVSTHSMGMQGLDVHGLGAVPGNKACAYR